MIDKPLYPNPLGGGLGQIIPNPGSGLADGVTPRGGGFETSFGLLDSNPDRERQYFYNKDLNKLFNMPMGVRMAAPKGFESVNKDQYEDYANKGATLQGASMFTDSMGGGYNLDLPRDQFGSIDRTSSEYDYFYGDSQQKPNIGAGILGNMFMGNATPPSTPVSEQTPIPDIIGDPFKPKSDDPLMQGYYDSDFYSNTMTMDMMPYTFRGKEMMGSSSGASNLKKYLESIGKGDLLQFKNNDLMSQDLLGTVNPNDPSQQLLGGDNNYTRSVQPIVTGPQEIATQQAPMDSYNRVGQQLMGLNQNNNIVEILKNIEQGIASLGLNYGQGNNMNQSSNYGNFDNFGIGSFFPPYGGMYG
jgi:hypothetical protein